MIESFKDEETRKVFLTGKSRRFGSVAQPALRRLGDMERATDVMDLRDPPGNHLERLKGDRAGQWSIRINDQFRICFEWDGKNFQRVEITDYH